MPKKKKTREQKISADKRRKIEIPSAKSTPPAITHSYNSEVIPTAQPTTKVTAITTNDYAYLVSDLIKTVLLTTGIIIAEYVLYLSFF